MIPKELKLTILPGKTTLKIINLIITMNDLY